MKNCQYYYILHLITTLYSYCQTVNFTLFKFQLHLMFANHKNTDIQTNYHKELNSKITLVSDIILYVSVTLKTFFSTIKFVIRNGEKIFHIKRVLYEFIQIKY